MLHELKIHVMRINLKLVILFSAIIIISLVISTFVGLQYTEAAVIDSSLQEMKNLVSTKEKEIQTLHARASEDMIFSVKNPQFKEYFELSETKTGNVYDENEVLQFSSSQREIKDDLRLSDISKILNDMSHPLVIHENRVISPWDICIALAQN